MNEAIRRYNESRDRQAAARLRTPAGEAARRAGNARRFGRSIKDEPGAPPTAGYTPCACRDCMEIAVSADVTTPDLCHDCEAAGCEPGEECSAPGAYGAEDAPAAGGAQ